MAGNFNISYIFDAVDKLSPVIKKMNENLSLLNKHFEKQQLLASQTKLDQVSKKLSSLNKEASKPAVKTFTERLKEISKQSDFANNSIVRLATGYLSFQGVLGLTKSLINTQVQMQNINASLIAVTGSQQKATKEFNFVKKSANELGVSIQDLILPYTKFLASSKFTTEENRKIFTSFSKMAVVFGMTGEQSAGVFRALEQMQNKGKVMSEELKLQLGDRLPAALQLFAEASGVSTEKFVKLMEEGRIGAGILKNVADVIEKKYGKASIEASKTLGAELARLKNAFFELKIGASQGLFSDFILNGIKLLINNMRTLFNVAIGLLTIFGAMALLKLPGIILSMGANFLLVSINALKVLKVFSLFMVTNPFGLIILAIGLLILKSKKFREDFVTVFEFLKDLVSDIGSYLLDKIITPITDFFSNIFSKIEGFFSRMGNKIREFGGGLGFGKEDFSTKMNRFDLFSKQTVGLEGIINIKNLPAGSTAEMSTFGTTKSNLGLNMSFAPGGL